MSTAMDWLKTIANMTPEEFDTYMDIEGIDCSRSEPHSGTRTILGYPVTEEMYEDGNGNILPLEINAIFRSGGTSGGSGNTTSNNTWTWTIPGHGSGGTPNVPATPAVTQTLYRRSTHDENGDAKQFTKEQEQLWHDLASIATMTSPYIWKTAEEVYRDAEDYQKRTRVGGMYISKDSVETGLATLVMNGMVEQKNA